MKESASSHQCIGYLLLKRLIVLDPDDGRDVETLRLRQPVYVGPDTGLLELLQQFQKGKSHVAVVAEQHCEIRKVIEAARKGKPAHPDIVYPVGAKLLGFVTIEDVLEAMLQEDIDDEGDVSRSLHQATGNIKALVTQRVGVERAIRKFKSMADRARRRTAARGASVLTSPSDADSGVGAGAKLGAGAQPSKADNAEIETKRE